MKLGLMRRIKESSKNTKSNKRNIKRKQEEVRNKIEPRMTKHHLSLQQLKQKLSNKLET
jgi:hypothetical protein